MVGLIDDGSEDFRFELCPNNERTAKVLHGIIERHVAVFLFFAEKFLPLRRMPGMSSETTAAASLRPPASEASHSRQRSTAIV